MSAATYRLVVVGPGDEVMDTVPLDGSDLANPWTGTWLVDRVSSALGSRHVAACAALPDPEGEDA